MVFLIPIFPNMVRRVVGLIFRACGKTFQCPLHSLSFLPVYKCRCPPLLCSRFLLFLVTFSRTTSLYLLLEFAFCVFVSLVMFLSYPLCSSPLPKCQVHLFTFNPYLPACINPSPVQLKSVLHGQQGCVFSSGHLNLRTCQCVLVHLGRQAAFKSSTL
jgi:hypothetical protein